MNITDNKDKFVKLYHYLGSTRKVLKKLEQNGVEEQNCTQAKAALSQHYNPQRNAIYLLNQLYHMKQNSTESMDHFYMRGEEQVQLIKSQDKSATQIEELVTLAQLVNVTHDSTLRTKALRDSDLKLKTFLDNARAHEMANQQACEIAGSSTDTMAVRRKALPQQSKKKKSEPQHDRKSHGKSQSCNYCGGNSHPRQECCPKNAICHKCKLEGHFAQVYRRRSVNEVSDSASSTQNEDSDRGLPRGSCLQSGCSFEKSCASHCQRHHNSPENRHQCRGHSYRCCAVSETIPVWSTQTIQLHLPWCQAGAVQGPRVLQGHTRLRRSHAPGGYLCCGKCFPPPQLQSLNCSWSGVRFTTLVVR